MTDNFWVVGNETVWEAVGTLWLVSVLAHFLGVGMAEDGGMGGRWALHRRFEWRSGIIGIVRNFKIFKKIFLNFLSRHIVADCTLVFEACHSKNRHFM